MADHGVVCSMSRSGNVWDNAAMESFFSSLKTERTGRKTYRTRDEARVDVFDYIERFYNTKRRHSKISYMSPKWRSEIAQIISNGRPRFHKFETWKIVPSNDGRSRARPGRLCTSPRSWAASAAEGAAYVRRAQSAGQAYKGGQEKPTTRAISDSPAVRSADQERETLPVTSDDKRTLSIARRRKR
jgi:hypothetical protein